MRIINNHEFSEAERLKFKQVIAVNIDSAITTLIANLSTNDYSSLSKNSDLMGKCWVVLIYYILLDINCTFEASLDRVESIKSVRPETIFEVADDIKALWECEEIQATFLRRNEFQIEECAKYFLSRVHQVTEKSYIPTEQDMVQVRERTTGIIEHHFQMKNAGSVGNEKHQTLILVYF